MKKLLVLSLVVLMAVIGMSVKITMAAGAVGKELEVLMNQIKMFNKVYPDIEVQLLPMPNSSTSRHDLYVTYLGAMTPDPDILMIDVVWPAEFAPFVEDLTNDYDYFGLKDFLPGTVKSATVQGKIVAVPWFTDAGLLYYRKDLLEKYGYDVPQTWEELKKVASDIASKEKINGMLFQLAQYEGLVCDVAEFVHSYGADFLDANGKVIISDPDNHARLVKALTTLKSFVDDGVAPKGVLTYMEEETRRPFQNGESVFLRNWPYVWSLANDPKQSKIAGKIGVAPLPMGDIEGGRHSATLGGWMLAINKYSSAAEKDAAKKFVKFLTSYDQQLYKAINAGQNPTRKAVYSDPKLKEAAPFMVELYNVFINAEPRPITPLYTEVSDAIQRHVHDFLLGKVDVEKALKDLDSELKMITGQ
jgi:multiple sugar transport system substrate-binding protein